MKEIMIMAVLNILVISGVAAKAVVKPSVEVVVERVFVSPEGYDDNDNVILVLHGHLPSLCYNVIDPSFTINAVSKTIMVRQLAVRMNYPDCQKGTTPKAYGQGGIFTTELAIGNLEAGSYKVLFDKDGKSIAEREFKVAKAKADSVDESIYAPVYSTFIPDMIYETKNAEILLSGVLETSCLDLDPANIQVEKFSDVVVILPRLTVLDGEDCKKVELPLQEVVSIGELTPGDYLLHVRSMTGRALNKTFKVVARPDMNKSVNVP